MAFQTTSLVDGQWATRTLDVDAVLRHHDQKDREATQMAPPIESAPVLGILTQTVIRSPLVLWILPVKLRLPSINEVAFIGVKELRGDGALWDVARKENLGARIRNARIVGSLQEYEEDPDIHLFGTEIKVEDVEMVMDPGDELLETTERSTTSILPPQFILLQLETGDSVFVMLKETSGGRLDFVFTSRHRASNSMLGLEPGMYLTVDPTSRYMALGCSEGLLSIYALCSRAKLKELHAKGPEFRHVEGQTFLSVQGVIQKMEFLRPKDKTFVVLLVLVIIRGKTRMLIYEWKTGDKLSTIRPMHRNGEALSEAYQMPLLLIPLMFKSAFILVSEDCVALYQGIQGGKSNCFEFHNKLEEPTTLHHGRGPPLWTAWARPDARLPYYKEAKDVVYLVREDGLVMFLEVDYEEENDVKIDGTMTVGSLGCNSGNALACLDYRNMSSVTGDLLVTGGESSAGGAYLVEARKSPVFMQPIQNWAPAQDFIVVSASNGTYLDQVPFEESTPSRTSRQTSSVPDRMFACVGKGPKGAITEFRYGIEARVGLETNVDAPILGLWALPAKICSADDGDDHSIFLLSRGDSSVVLQLSGDEGEIKELDEMATTLEQNYRTITTSFSKDTIIQVTEKSILFIDSCERNIYEDLQILVVREGVDTLGHGTEVHDAVVFEHTVLYTTYVDNAIYVQVLEGTADVLNPPYSVLTTIGEVRTLGRYSAQVTALALCSIGEHLCAIVAEFTSDVTLTFLPVHGGGPPHILNVTSALAGQVRPEAIVSISIICETSTSKTLLCGTRDGFLLTLQVDDTDLHIMSSRFNKFGSTSVTILKDELWRSDLSKFSDVLLVNCDSRIYFLAIEKGMDLKSPKRNRINEIWITDALVPGLSQPNITSIARQIPSNLHMTGFRVLLITGSQLLLVDLDIVPKVVPRYIEIGGTPSRLIYSKRLETLIVAASVMGKSTLLFIDPDTGENLSNPVESKGGPNKEFASYLGNLNERIVNLFEWCYANNGKNWGFIIATTNTGKLLVISLDNEEMISEDIKRPKFYENGTEVTSGRLKISYFTRHKFKCGDPVFSAVGFDEGLVWCAGDQLVCAILDIQEKRFKRIAEYDLPSAARNLRMDGFTIYALTQMHSLEVIQLEPDESGGWSFRRKMGDPLSRFALHHIVADRYENRPLHIVTDKDRSFVGLWQIENTLADTLETVFEGEIPYSVLRLRSARCRPIWDPVWSSKHLESQSDNLNDNTDIDCPPNSLKPYEIIGLSVDGSLSHFSVLDVATWKFLKFLVNLCRRSSKICEFTYSDDPPELDDLLEPKIRMHVDGDILKRCLDERRLEELLRIGNDTPAARKIFSRFCELLHGLHGGALGANASPKFYVQRAYSDLELYLRPVL